MNNSQNMPPDKTPIQLERQRADQVRRSQHFQVRLDRQLAKRLQQYADLKHQGVTNRALKTIVLKFLNSFNASNS